MGSSDEDKYDHPTQNRSLGGADFFFQNRDHFEFSFGGDYRHDMDHSGAPGKQGNSANLPQWRWNGDGRLLSAQIASECIR